MIIIATIIFTYSDQQKKAAALIYKNTPEFENFKINIF